MRKVANKCTVVIGMTTGATSPISDSHPARDLGEITSADILKHEEHKGKFKNPWRVLDYQAFFNTET